MNFPNGKHKKTPKIYPAGRRSLTKTSGASDKRNARGRSNPAPLLCYFFFPDGNESITFRDPPRFYGVRFFSGKGAHPHRGFGR